MDGNDLSDVCRILSHSYQISLIQNEAWSTPLSQLFTHRSNHYSAGCSVRIAGSKAMTSLIIDREKVLDNKEYSTTDRTTRRVSIKSDAAISGAWVLLAPLAETPSPFSVRSNSTWVTEYELLFNTQRSPAAAPRHYPQMVLLSSPGFIHSWCQHCGIF